MAPGVIPSISLPLQLIVVHHREEDLSRSTAVHAKVIAPNSTSFMVDEHGSPTDPVPPFDPETTVALFPSPAAKTMKELGKDALANIKSVVLVEGTWVKAHAAVQRANISNLTHIKLNEYETSFWRYQKKGQQNDSMLSSIEAIYYFFKEYLEVMHAGEYDGSCDNLLYLFAWQRSLVVANHANDKHANTKVIRLKRKAQDEPPAEEKRGKQSKN
jgi:DTW domain-containing protein YfiP